MLAGLGPAETWEASLDDLEAWAAEAQRLWRGRLADLAGAVRAGVNADAAAFRRYLQALQRAEATRQAEPSRSSSSPHGPVQAMANNKQSSQRQPSPNATQMAKSTATTAQ